MINKYKKNRYLVIGLGNPGKQFSGNRHNVGKMIITGLSKESEAPLVAKHPKAELAEVVFNDNEAIIATISDHMNSSGFGVSALVNHFDIDLNRLIVVHDDLDLDLGQIRIKKGGGTGGHNGLRSIVDILGSEEFLRVRLGIGRPSGKKDPAEFVLSDFNVVQFSELEFVLGVAIDVIKAIVTDGVDEAMNRYNIKKR